MDNSSSGMPVRPPLSNGPSFRRSPHSRGSLLLPAGAAAAAAAAGGGGGSGGGLEGGGGAGLGAGPPSPVNVVTVIVNKDENGYGMKVSGDNPVYVQSVKGGGAAEKAGLHSGDKIIKVNGVNVTQSTHTDVVALIKSATQVVLTVQQRPRPASAMALASPGGGAGGGSGAASAAVAAASAAAHGLGAGVGGVLGGLGGLAGGALGGALGGGGGGAPAGVGGGSGGSLASHHHHHHHTPHGRPLHHHHSAPARTTERITSPQPVDNERLRQLECQKVHMVRLMLEKEQRYVEALRSQLAARCPPASPLPGGGSPAPSPTASSPPGGPHPHPSSSSSTSPAPAPADAKLQTELEGAERRVRELERRVAALTAEAAANAAAAAAAAAQQQQHEWRPAPHSPSGTPPPLPSRNRPPSSASLTSNSSSASAAASPCASPAGGSCGGGIPPPLPPRPPHLQQPSSHHHHHHHHSHADGHHHQHHHHRCSVAVPQQVSSLHTHHRTKSSPDPLNMQNLSPSEASKRLIASESMSDLSYGSKRTRSSGGFDMDSPRVTPPGTPPPPYGGSSTTLPSDSGDTLTEEEGGVHDLDDHGKRDTPTSEVSPIRTSLPQYASTTILQQHPIISMEEDDMSDQEVSQLEDHGPFKSLSKLWEHTAHLAVFMNYVICNNDTSSLLFYLVTDLYKEGNAKEMKKWAYEIHSSFLVPGAPLRLNNVDENVAREIDDVLLNESDKEEILRKIFWKARVKAKEELNEQLADFQQKRTAGLGTLFGPPDTELDMSIHDKNVEIKIVEKVLLPNLEHYKEVIERDNTDIRRFTAAAALVTVLSKVFGLRAPHSNSLLDRCPTFVSKDKSLKSRLIGKSRKINVRGHHFVAHQYFSVTYCNHCQLIICGIGPQGYQCSDCSLNIHRHCVRIVEENCPGPLVKKERGNDRISKLMEKIRPEREPRRKPSNHNFSQIERMRKQTEEDSGGLTDGEGGTGDRPASGGRAERRPDPLREEERGGVGGGGSGGGGAGGGGGGGSLDGSRAAPDDDAHDPQHAHHHHDLPHHHPPTKPSAASINRSESYKERSYKERVQKRPLRERRKTSDPNLSSKTNDVDLENTQGLSYNTNSGSSSNSSLSTRSLDSPSNSVEVVGGAAGAAGAGEGFSALGHPASGLQDSDLEAEPDPPDWTQDVDEDTLRALSPQEKKRQEVINELFHTERTHVRNLKVLEQVFFRPMVENSVLGADEVQLLFANLEEMLLIHAGFNAQMKARRKESPVVYQLADLLLNMFDGPASENFQRAAASFCARQTIALEVLKERRRKDSRLNAFLTAAEGSQLCRRLQLKDIIPTAMQRLTKYPLLFENLAKYTSGSQEEVNGVQRAVERSKEILNHVNHAVRLAEDQQRLSDIQKKLDKSAFERAEHPIAAEFKNLDLTKHKLVHEGSLTWRIGNKAQKLIDLHVLLLEDFIILLQKQDDKFILKFYSHNAADRMLSPIIRVSTVLVRPNAVDNKALYLVNTSHNGAQIYDLVATSRADSKIWFRHISEAAEAYKAREGKGRRPEQPTPAASAAASATAAAAATAGAASSTAASAQPLPTPDADLPDAAAAQHHAKDKEAEDAGEGPAAPPNDADAAAASPSPAPAGADAGPDAAHATPSPAAAATTPGASPSPDASAAADAAAAAKKLGGSLATPSPGLQRRLDSLRCTTEECPLVQPSEVVVSLRPVLTAEPVLTPIEKLRRKDALIREALAEKQQLVADLLSVPRDDFETIADLAGEPGAYKESSELVLAAVNQVNQLTSVVNEALKVTEEEAVSAASEAVPKRLERLPSVPAHQLQSIASALNSHLTQLLKTVKTQDEERDNLRRELQRLREQVHTMHESRRRSQLEASSSASATAATASATIPLPNHEDDTGESTLAHKGDDDLDGNSSALDSHDDGTAEEFVDALSGEGDCPPEEDPPCSDPPAETPPSAEGTEDKIVDE